MAYNSEMKPCPFCGSKRVLPRFADPGLWVMCDDCNACGPDAPDPDDGSLVGAAADVAHEKMWNEAIRLWNNRTDPLMREVRDHIAEQIEHIKTRIQDGSEMGATVWRIALEDIVRENTALLARIEEPKG